MNAPSGSIQALANDPAVRAALARIPRVAPPATPIEPRNPKGAGSKLSVQRGHAMRRVIGSALAILGQRSARGQADDLAYDNLAHAIAEWEALRQ